MTTISKTKEHPFFWNKIKGRFVEDILIEGRNINEITFCSAFLSEYGVDIVEKIVKNNNLNRKNVKVYISREFSSSNCCSILERLMGVAEVKIYAPNEDVMFHPKLIYIKSNDSTAEYLIGSSNLTLGGLSNNVEMNVFLKASEDDKKHIEQFIMMVEHKSKSVDEAVILRYKEFQEEINAIYSMKKLIEKKYRRIFIGDEDPFEKEEYNLQNHYFQYEDYETFFSRNTELMHVEHREVVQNKILDLHVQVFKEIKRLKLDLSPHWMDNHITSLITPQIYNHYVVEWMGVRYGKRKSELDKFWDDEGKSEFEGFQKHACLQFSINESSLITSLFHAVPNGAHDRFFLEEEITKPKFQSSLINALRVLEGKNASWYIGNEEFSFENKTADGFIKFYKDNDAEGKFSYLSISYNIDSDMIRCENIVNTIVSDFETLYPIYKIVAKRY